MAEKYFVLTDKNVDYRCYLNFNSMETIQEEYETYGKWVEEFQKGDAKAIKIGIWAYINEGIEIWNEDNPSDKKDLLTKRQVGRLITRIGFDKVVNAMINEIHEASDTDEEIKNA